MPEVQYSTHVAQVWSMSLEQRELLQLSWTKGHLDAAQHCQKFGLENWWMWATNLEADMACSRKAHGTDCIDQAAREKFSHLGQRCAQTLASDPVPRFKEAKFEATPVAGRQAKPSGPNKRQRLLAATQGMNAHTGHNWVVTAKTCASSAQCVLCMLSRSTLLRSWILSSATRVSADRLSPWPQQAIHPSHLTLNLDHQWSCSRCKAHHSVRARVKGPLSKECKGDRKKGGQKPSPAPRLSSAQGFAALFAGRVPFQ